MISVTAGGGGAAPDSGMSAHLYSALLYLHLLSALVWLGGMFFLALVGAPLLRRVEPPELRARLFHELGVRFRGVGWAAIGVLLLTGAGMLHQRGLLSLEVMGDATFRATPFGRALAWKLAAVGIMVAIGAWHDFVAGPRAGGAVSGGADVPEAVRLRRRRSASLMARTNAVVGLVLLFWAMRLARGG